MNRGLARRTAFETAADARAFLSLLAREVRAHKLAIHAFCVMTTHFHLLVQSVDGDLGSTIGRVLNGYVRRFNRGRRRDGSLFRGRFRSRPVTSETYRRVLVRYIDFNPVQARLVQCPLDYPHGSARRHVQPTGSPWLERQWIRAQIELATGTRTFDKDTYAAAFGETPDVGLQRLVARRLAIADPSEDPLDELLAAAPAHVLAWMQRKAAIGDGTTLGIPVCDIAPVQSSVECERQRRATWTLRGAGSRRKPRDGWLQVENALLRDLCGTTCEENGRLLGRTASWASSTYRTHCEMLVEDPTYAELVARVAASALDRGHPGRASSVAGIRRIHDATRT